MKKLLLILIISCISTNCYASIDLDRLAFAESNGNRWAYNRSTNAVGAYQIRQICVDDYNMFHQNKFTLKEMYNTKKARKVVLWYTKKRLPQLLKHYGHKVNDINILKAYNNGAKRVGKVNRKATKILIERYYNK